MRTIYRDEKSVHQQRVEQFMRGAGQDVPRTPMAPTADVLKLRIRLILEELLETANAAGVTIRMDNTQASGLESTALNNPVKDTMAEFSFWSIGSFDSVEFVDGCCDLTVVVTGSLSACGVADARVQEAVDLDNLKKFRPGHFVDKGGKLIKPKDHVGVKDELTAILEDLSVGTYMVVEE